MVDFGADDAFMPAANKLKEHYGIEVPVSAIRTKTEAHGEWIQKAAARQLELPDRPGVPQLIVELDGSMIPQVEIPPAEPGQEPVDRRKLRQLKWTEARLCLAHEPGSVTPVFGATLAALGGPDEAGAQLLNCAIRAGAGTDTKVHGVGDGAVWIADQVEEKFGLQASYTVDFYHLCEYLGAAAERIDGDNKRAWMDRAKQQMKENRSSELLQDLQPFLESDTTADTNAPVRACHRYITNRPDQFNYQTALQSGLPIGSGEVESGHGYVIQDRLKISGAWWNIENAAKMLALRVSRVNGNWDSYWGNLYRHVA
jgi:Uncharacterised protein family (UPF0236)